MPENKTKILMTLSAVVMSAYRAGREYQASLDFPKLTQKCEKKKPEFHKFATDTLVSMIKNTSYKLIFLNLSSSFYIAHPLSSSIPTDCGLFLEHLDVLYLWFFSVLTLMKNSRELKTFIVFYDNLDEQYFVITKL